MTLLNINILQPALQNFPYLKMRSLSIVLVFLALALLLSPKPHKASRILCEGKEEWMKKKILLFQSLQRAPVPASGPNPSTHIPADGNKANTINQKSFTGHAMPSVVPHVNPQHMIPLVPVTKA